MDLSVLLLSSTIHSLCGSESDISGHKSNSVTWYKPSNNYFIVLLINPNFMLWLMWPSGNWPWSTSLLSSLTCLPVILGDFFFLQVLAFSVLKFHFPSLVCSSPSMFLLEWALFNAAVPDHLSIICTQTFFHSLWCYLYIFSITLFSVWIITVWVTSLHRCLFMSLCCSVAQSCPTCCDPMDVSTLGLPVSHRLPEFAQVHVHCISDAVQSPHPLMPSFPSALNLSQHQGLFHWVSVCIRWPKYWCFSFSFTPSSEYSGFFSLKIDWFDLLAAQSSQ